MALIHDVPKCVNFSFSLIYGNTMQMVLLSITISRKGWISWTLVAQYYGEACASGTYIPPAYTTAKVAGAWGDWMGWERAKHEEDGLGWVDWPSKRREGLAAAEHAKLCQSSACRYQNELPPVILLAKVQVDPLWLLGLILRQGDFQQLYNKFPKDSAELHIFQELRLDCLFNGSIYTYMQKAASYTLHRCILMAISWMCKSNTGCIS